jgi:hypothetical protein
LNDPAMLEKQAAMARAAGIEDLVESSGQTSGGTSP